MKKLLTISIFRIMTGMVFGQNEPFATKFSHEIEEGIADGSIGPSRAGTLYSLIGEYYRAATYSDIPVSWGVDSLEIGRYTLEVALPYIIEAAKSHQIVIISENHLKPQHRIFAKEILLELAKHGFRHLGLETFAHSENSTKLLDSALIERGYPLNSPLTGTYTMEPQMGDLVRTALSLGYSPFAYEQSEKIDGKDRDEVQADNIIKYLESNSGAKIVIVCGFHHAIESDIIKRRNSYWMAKYLKDKIGLDPLTIYQDNFTEKFIENEHPSLRKLIIDGPSVFTDMTGGIVRFSDQVDIEIVHPITRYRNGRPNWLYEDDQRKPVMIKIDREGINFPVIVSAFKRGEKNGTPVDRIEIRYRYDQKTLVLKTGEYEIQVFDGKNYVKYNETVN